MNFGESRVKKILNRLYFIAFLRRALENRTCPKGDFRYPISQERFIQLSWHFLYINTQLSSTGKKYFSSKRWVVGILWIPQFKEKSLFVQLWPFISRDWKKIETWNFVYKHILMLSNYYINLSFLERSIRASHLKQNSIFDWKVDFGPRFSPKVFPKFFMYLPRIRDSTFLYNLV